MIWQAWAALVVVVILGASALIALAIAVVEFIGWCRRGRLVRRAARLVRWTDRVVSTCPRCQARWLRLRRVPLAPFLWWCRLRRHARAAAPVVEAVPP